MTDITTQPREGDVIRITAEGDREFGQLRHFRGWQNTNRGRLVQHSPLNNPNAYAYSEADGVEVVEPPSVRSGFSLEHHLWPAVQGWKPWGDVEELDPLQVAGSLPGGGWRNGILSGVDPVWSTQYRSWAVFFPIAGQGVPYTGEAYALVYGRGEYRYDHAAGVALAQAVRAQVDGAPPPGDLAAALAAYEATRKHVYVPRAYRVAICKHEKIVGPGANPSRGWHPGHCGKCGLNMSVDSGD